MLIYFLSFNVLEHCPWEYISLLELEEGKEGDEVRIILRPWWQENYEVTKTFLL